MFADVAGFTALSEKLDPEQVHQISDGFFHIMLNEVHKYEGIITQFAGDGIMALFGAPLAHEDHAQRACYAALSIQREMKGYGEKIKGEHGLDFRVRVGLHSGLVVVGHIGDDLRMDYTAIGDTANLASRMESSARPGTVRVSGPTYKLARDFFDFENLGPVTLKGKEEPQEAFELKGLSPIETRIQAAALRGLTRFVGREKELGALHEAWEKARSGSGQLVGLVGEAGVGKSRLLLELRNGIAPEDYKYLEGHCLHYGASMAYLPVLDILRSYLEVKEGDPESSIQEKMGARFFRFGEKGRGLLPPLQELLSLPAKEDIYLKLDHREKRGQDL